MRYPPPFRSEYLIADQSPPFAPALLLSCLPVPHFWALCPQVPFWPLQEAAPPHPGRFSAVTAQSSACSDARVPGRMDWHGLFASPGDWQTMGRATQGAPRRWPFAALAQKVPGKPTELRS